MCFSHLSPGAVLHTRGCLTFLRDSEQGTGKGCSRWQLPSQQEQIRLGWGEVGGQGKRWVLGACSAEEPAPRGQAAGRQRLSAR